MLNDEVKVSFVSLKLHIALVAYIAFTSFAKQIAIHVELLNLDACIKMVKFQKLILLVK